MPPAQNHFIARTVAHRRPGCAPGCPYCRARLATVTCAACFAAMFDGTAFCPACGTARAVADIAGVGAAVPRLHHGALDCRRRGHVDCSSAARVTASGSMRRSSSKSAPAASLARRCLRVPPASRVTATERRIRYRPCVRCGKMMNRVNFGRLSGTIIDVCRGHGTFLDSGELHAIVTFIHGGGLERVRQHELDSLKEARRQLDAAKSSHRRTRQSTALGSERWDAPSLSDLMAAIFGR